MNDRYDTSTPPSGEDPEQAHVARLLAAAGGPVEVPDDVASRLDAVLADLVAERADNPAPVTELASRRRRWPRLLVAAAAVAVLGLGAGELLGDAEGDADRTVATSDSGLEAVPEPSPSPGELLAAQKSTSDDAAAPSPEAARDTAGTAPAPVPRLRRDSLDADLERIAALAALGTVTDQRDRAARKCVRPRLTSGDEVLVVRLDGDPAVLVMRAPEGGRRTAALYTCDDAETPVVETTVRTR